MEIPELTFPIPNFPPFKLRSSLIDKDPVIWEHLLNDYITLFRKLLALVPSRPKESPQYALSAKTINQLHLFLYTFLAESADEVNQVFSLGAINPNIRQNQHLLKLAVFSYIKTCNLVNLKLQGKSIWDFCKVYLRMADSYSQKGINQAFISAPIIRKLVEGSLKSSLNSKSNDVSLIKSLQEHLAKIIAEGKWKKEDDQTLYLLLGQKTKVAVGSKSQDFKAKKKITSSSSSDGFAKQFVNSHWNDLLHEMYANGEGVSSKTCTQVMALSLCSLTSATVVNLIKSVEVKSATQLKLLYPLLSKIVFSKTFNDMNPNLKDMLSFLRPKKATKEKTFSNSDIVNIQAIFPQLASGQIKTLLDKHNNNVELIINNLFEINEDDFSKIEDFEQLSTQKKSDKPSNIVNFEMEEGKNYEVMFGKKELVVDDPSEEIKKKTLSNALAMLYDPNEDEPDDTYAENEVTSGLRAHEKEPLIDKNVQILFGIYKSNKKILQAPRRNKPSREELKKELNWTDEQIEGWARNLDKNPHKYKELEERLIYVDGNLNQGSQVRQRSKWTSKKAEDSDESQNTSNDRRKGGKPKKVATVQEESSANFNSYMNKKKEQRNKEKHKKQVGNHNRKAASLYKSNA